MKILLTGFRPWDANKVNPSGVAAAELGGVVLPVDFDQADRELRKEIRRRKPDVLVMLGLAPTRKLLSLEAVALNVDHCEEPGENEAWRRTIEQGAPPALESRLPLEKIQLLLKDIGVESSISHHAGTFLCNHVFYRGLRWMDGPCGFVHVPPFRELPKPRLLQAVRTILHAVAGSSPAATP